MVKRIITIGIAAIAAVLLSAPLKAQMTDEAVYEYAKEALASGKSTTEIVADLAARGVTVEQAKRLQSNMQGTTATAGTVSTMDFSKMLGETGGQERMRRMAGTMSADSQIGNIAEQLALTDGGAATPGQSGVPGPLGSVAVMQNPYIQATSDSKSSQKDTSDIFGHAIFRQENLTFAPNENIATPENYKLGPGDEVFIDIWGTNKANIRETISPDGFIVVEDFGLIFLNGLTIKEAEKYVRRQLGKIYSIDGEDAQSDMKLSLGAVRTINVNVLGEVFQPGTYYLSSLSSIFHALYMAGGFTDLGSVRKIRLVRDGKDKAVVDLYEFLINGKAPEDIILQEGDVVIVPTYDRIVEVKGEVKRPMKYELKDGETVQSAITFAGGFKGGAYTPNLSLFRRDGRELQVFTVRENEYASFQMMDGDVMNIGSVLNRFENRVEVRGAVYRPGVYQLGDNVKTVRELIGLADGLKGDAFMNRAIIQREKEDYTFETIAFDLKGVMDGSAADVQLKNNDILYVASVHDLKDMGNITVSGEVARPGTFMFASNTTIEDAIILAGGLLESASTAKVDVSRRVKNPASGDVTDTLSYTFTYQIKDGFIVGGDEFVLQPYDRVYVRKSPAYSVQNHVVVEGEVVFPGVYAISKKDMRLSSIINECGGTTKWAYIKGAKLMRRMTKEEREILDMTMNVLGNTKEGIEGLIDMKQNEYTVGIDLEAAIANPGSDIDVVLRDGDRIVVPEFVNTVKISGNVMYPNVVTYNPELKLKKYVEMAGGYGYKAKRNKAYVLYMNGTVAKARNCNKKTIQPGCEVIIPTRITDPTILPLIMNIVSATSSTASMLATLYTLIESVRPDPASK